MSSTKQLQLVVSLLFCAASIEAAEQRIDFGFTIQSMKLAPNGKTLIAWGPSEGRAWQGNERGPCSVVVIDTQSKKVLARRDMPDGVREFTLDDRYIYFAPASGNMVYRMSHELTDAKRHALDQTPGYLFKLSPDVLVVRAKTINLFDVDDMEPIPIPLSFAYETRLPSLEDIGFGRTTRLFGKVFDRVTGKLLRIESTQLPALASVRLRGTADSVTTKVWGRMASQGVLYDSQGNMFPQPTGAQLAIISEDHPVGIMVSQSNGAYDKPKNLVFLDLVERSVKKSTVIAKSSSPLDYPDHREARQLLLTHSKGVYVASGRELLFDEIPEILIESLVAPPHFLKQQKYLLDSTKETQFELGVGGAKEGMTFSLLSEYPGIQLNEKTGVIKVDAEALWLELRTKTIKQATDVSFLATEPIPALLNRDKSSKLFRDLIGEELPEGMVVARMPITAKLLAPVGQEDVTQFQVVVLGASKPITDAIQTIRDGRASLNQVILSMEKAVNGARKMIENTDQ